MLTFFRSRRRYKEGSKEGRKPSVLSELDADYIKAIIESAKDKADDEWQDMVVRQKPVQIPQVSGIAASS